MARFLPWSHITQEQLAAVRHGKLSPADSELQCILLPSAEASSYNQGQQQILYDLYSYALHQGQLWRFDDEKLSCLLGLVKATHAASVNERLTIEHSFTYFKESLLNHSVQRPPFSMGVFNQVDSAAILRWMLQTYYRHYKLYQYAFTSRVTMSVTSRNPCDLVEVAPTIPPLARAITEDQHQQQLDTASKQRQEEERAAAAAAAAVEEAAQAEALQREYEASLPDDVRDKVHAVLARELGYLRKKMDEQFQEQQAELLAKIATLEVQPKH